MDKVFSDKRAIALFVLPALLLFTIIILLPIFLSSYYSLLKWDGIGEQIFVGFRNYLELFSNNADGFIKAVRNSIILAVLSVFVQIPIALILALVLSKGVKGENLYRTIYFIPVIISTTVIGQLWMKIYHPEYGMLNILLESVGLGEYKNMWLANTKTSLFSAFVPIVWQYIGYHMLLIYASIKSISTDIFEAAKIDGASAFVTSYKITIPLVKPILKVCIIFAIIGSLKSFDLIYILTNGGPAHSSEVPSTLMYSTIFDKYQYGYGSAMSVFIMLECLVFTMITQRLFREKPTK